MSTKPLSTTERQFKRMTETPIARLIISLGIPTTISMLITNVYNMADSYFVSQISLAAGGATSIVFGIMSIIQAFGFMFGHGAGSNISRLLGKRQTEEASKYATISVMWALIAGLLIMTFGLIFIEPFMLLLGSTQTILPHAIDYATYIFYAAPAMAVSCVLNNILRYEGKASLAMIGLTTGGVLNMILDPIFIFGFGLDIAGAGLATALSQYISFGILASVFLLDKTESKISPKYLLTDFKALLNIIVTGLPSLARQGLNSVSTMVLNTTAKPFGDAAIAAMGYVGRTSSLIFSVGLGIGQGFQPVSGFNYGAKKYTRVKKGSIFTMLFGAGFIGAIALVCFILAPNIISLFRTDADVIAIGSTALRIQCAFLVCLPISVVATMLFQSIGKSVKALVLSCLQSGLLFIPICLILPKYIGVLGIELAQPIAYFLTMLVSLPMLIAFLKKLPKDDEEGTNI